MTAIPKRGPVIAIDGPAGTGKSSATKLLCARLGFTHVDTGALYRSIAYLVGPNVPGETPEGFIARATAIAQIAHLEFRRDPSKTPAGRVFANGEDVTDKIRTPEVSLRASQVSAIPAVRAVQLSLQRRLGCEGRTVLEGRDIGTVVFPDADVKFFLTASASERASRRLKELQQAGGRAPTYEELLRQIEERDHSDANRAVAPMKKAADAIEIDTSSLTLAEVVDQMAEWAQARLNGGKSS